MLAILRWRGGIAEAGAAPISCRYFCSVWWGAHVLPDRVPSTAWRARRGQCVAAHGDGAIFVVIYGYLLGHRARPTGGVWPASVILRRHFAADRGGGNLTLGAEVCHWRLLVLGAAMLWRHIRPAASAAHPLFAAQADGDEHGGGAIPLWLISPAAMRAQDWGACGGRLGGLSLFGGLLRGPGVIGWYTSVQRWATHARSSTRI